MLQPLKSRSDPIADVPVPKPFLKHQSMLDAGRPIAGPAARSQGYNNVRCASLAALVPAGRASLKPIPQGDASGSAHREHETHLREAPLATTESEIDIRLWERTFPYIRQSLLAAAFLFPLFLGWDELVDTAGEADTVAERLLAGAVYGLLYLVVAFTRMGRRCIRSIYVSGILAAPLLLMCIFLQLPDGYLLGHSSFLIVPIVVMMIGPTLSVAVPLVVAALAIPSLGVFILLGAGFDLPGLPDGATALRLGLVDIGVGALAIVLVVVHDRLQRRMVADNVQLAQLAGTDPLTALQNRRQFQAEFERERARQRRHRRATGLLELDIDHFKQVNDTHGHDIGDEVLRSLAQRWRGLIREIDVLARLGGEEFVVMVPETDRAGIVELAERLRAATEDAPVSTPVGPLQITVSIGATLAAPDEASLENLLKRVDQALYRAKRSGRNRCEFAETES